MRKEGWVWWPTGLTADELGDHDPLNLYLRSILASVEDARKRYRVKPGPVYVFGHSMGGFTSISLGLRHPEAVASYFAYAGGLQDGEATPQRLAAMRKAKVRPWIVHGKADPVVEPLLSEKAYEAMAKAGVTTRLHLLDDVAHGIAPRVDDLIRTWLKEVVLEE
jgi:predicted esterase